MGEMAQRDVRWIVPALLGVSVVAAALVPPIPQDPAYHRLADARTVLGVPNALNVVSNAPFVLVGALGAWAVGPGGRSVARFIDDRERWPWMVFFAGLFLTGFGSAYYHLAPDHTRLMWDRLPLAIALMGLFAAVITERIGVGLGLAALAPLVAIGIASVLWWHAGEMRGRGDLRAYAIVQFYPIVAVPLMLYAWPPRYTLGSAILATVGVYGFAKVFELLDAEVLRLGGVVSGHTLKHLVAGAAGFIIVWMLAARRPTAPAQRGAA
jgi:hypothetical protein